MREIFLSHVRNDKYKCFDSALALVSPDREKEILQKRTDLSKNLTLLAELKAKTEAAKFLGADIASLQIIRCKNGKPYIAGAKDFFFNISHSSNLLAVAISDSEIGIDCEKISYLRKSVMSRQFTPFEQEYVQYSNERFFEVWTRKEAYFKYTGEGILGNLSFFDVFNSDASSLINTFKFGEYIISLCGAHADGFNLTVMPEDDIIDSAFSIFNFTSY